MQVKLISASDMHGGANIAAFRLLQGLKALGHEAELVVSKKFSEDPAVTSRSAFFCNLYANILPYIDPLPKLMYPKRHRDAWSCNFLPNPCFLEEMFASADVVNLHWVGGGTLPIQTIGRLNRPIVWTLHDSWPFTGGCHIPYDCNRYERKCGNCPQLRSGRERDLSRIIWGKKFRSWQQLPLTVVAPSTWMASAARASSLFANYPVEIIPNGLNTEIFKPMERLAARRCLNLPAAPRIVLFSAMGGVNNWNKGADLLREGLRLLKEEQTKEEILLLLAGADTPPVPDYFPFPFVNLGRVDDDDKKRWMYAAADVTAVPSRSESLGYAAMESMACNTPCVAFDVGGLPDLINHKINGYLARPYATEGLCRGISWILADETRRLSLGRCAREKIVADFSLEQVVGRYLELYRQLASTKS